MRIDVTQRDFGRLLCSGGFAILLTFALILGAGVTLAESLRTPALLADTVSYNADLDALIATGNVEIFFEDRVLRANRVTYFNATGNVEAEGPMTLSAPGEDTVVAEFASLNNELKTGIIQGARLVLAQNFQFAAQQVERVSPRYSVLTKTVASSCQVCANNPTPLWLIRAKKIIQDNDEKQIHFEDARFEVYGVTVAALPYFRIPDPSVRRATGLLRPQIQSDDVYGTGIKLPYFIVINDHSDVTITPFLTTSGTALLEGEYRRRFRHGNLSFNSAFALDDNNTARGLRGFIYSDGAFDISPGYKLNFSLRRAGDKSFLSEFGFSETDRLTSNITLSRQRNTEFISYSATGFQSLRIAEDDANIPYVLPEVFYERYWDGGPFDGRVTAFASTVGLTRKLGRDVYKFGGGANWDKSFELHYGLLGKASAGLEGWAYATHDDPAFQTDPTGYVVPTFALDVRWPLVRRDRKTTQILEPVAQLVHRDVIGDLSTIPNEDSVQVEFDASNLFSLDRFPGTDLVEEGFRLNLGLNYTHLNDDGWKFGLTLGRVLRQNILTDFSASTGLNSLQSNFVAAANLDFSPYFNLSNQTLFDENLSFSRNDIQANVKLGALDMTANYVYLLPDITASSFQKRHEITLNTDYRLNQNWSFGATYRRNLATARDVERKLRISYGNECISTDFSVSRRFTNSNSIPPSTEIGLSISLAGLGGTDQAWPAHKCRAQ